MKKLILNFNSKDSKKIKNPKNFLGGKGANLSEMGRMGLPVPPGFTISTKVCEIFYKDKKKLNKNLISQIKKELKLIEKDVSKKFGDLKNPLLLSVRSGARVSMPGMMDTILNLGLNDKTVKALAIKTSNGRFAKDSYRRFIQMYGNVVMGVEGYHFEELIENYKLTKGVLLDTDLDESDWDGLIEDFKRTVREKAKKDFPQDVHEQLLGAISAVFLSWESNRAKVYRKLNQIPAEWGTAVNVQSMVFGNMGDDCATGVVFTRNPSDGSKNIYGEYLINAQGEDVVAGTRTPQHITKKARVESKETLKSMEETMPATYKQLKNILNKLEKHYKDMQDVEFTVENKKLWMLQTRSGKRTAKSAVKIAVDMVKEKLITKKDAILRIEPSSLDTLLHPTLDEKANLEVIGLGLPASPGAASGKVGSADVLLNLGLNLDCSLEKVIKAVSEIGITFLFAPVWHKSLIKLAPLRKDLGIRTVFNQLGPLVNPLRPNAQVLGVASEELLKPMGSALLKMGMNRAIVVHGSGGLDEASLQGENKLVFVDNGELRFSEINISDFNHENISNEKLVVSDQESNEEILKSVLNGSGQKSHIDVVALNSALVLWAAGIEDDLNEGFKKALFSINQGDPWKKFLLLKNYLHTN